MNAQVGVAVMAHPRRTKFVNEMVGDLDRHAEIVWDRNNDRWDTGSRALLAHRARPEATHWMVVQDDAIVCRDLCAGVERALHHLALVTSDPTPLCLYIGRRFKRECRMQRDPVSWFTMPLYWGVAIVLPTAMIDSIVEWGNGNGHIENYDHRIGKWLENEGIRVWYPWPSLVDHRLSPSLVPDRGITGRYAVKFIGENESALSLDLTGKIVHNLDAMKRRRR